MPAPGPDDVLVRTIWSAISRGTESLVFRGGVPVAQHATMRAPFQEGDFPAPVKYGYLNVGLVESGPPELLGRTVFCLYPHQTRYVVPAGSVVPVPDDLPTRRAVLAGTVETAVNAIWDATPLPGDRVVVIGAGMVGASVARLLVGIIGLHVTLVDSNPDRRRLADALGVPFAHPDQAPGDVDLAVHTSGTGAGLQTALDRLTADGTVLDLSWYGDQPVTLSLGGSFHERRLAIRASQVGAVAASRRSRRTPRDRITLALDLLRDNAFDALLSGTSVFADLPETMARVVASDELCHTISYEGE